MLSPEDIAMLRRGRLAPIVTAEEAEREVWRMVSVGSSMRSASAARLVEWIRSRELAYISLREGVGRMMADAAERVGEAQLAEGPPDPAPTGFRSWDDSSAAVFLVAGRDRVVGRTAYDQPAAIDPSLVIRVTLDKGLPTERVLGDLRAPWTYVLPAGTWGVSCEVVGSPGRYRNRSTVVVV